MRAGAGRAVPPPSAAIRAIALNTFREAIRDRVLYLLLVFALILIGVSRLLSMLTSVFWTSGHSSCSAGGKRSSLKHHCSRAIARRVIQKKRCTNCPIA